MSLSINQYPLDKDSSFIKVESITNLSIIINIGHAGKLVIIKIRTINLKEKLWRNLEEVWK